MGNIMSLFFYICIFMLASAHFSLYRYKQKTIRTYGLFMAVLIPSLMSGMRYQVGTDYGNYDYIFTLVRSSTWKQLFSRGYLDVWEPGFKFLVKLLSGIGSNKFIFGMLCFIPLSLIVWQLVHNYSEYHLTTVYTFFLFFVFPMSLNLVRQFFAVAIVFAGMEYIFQKKIWKYIAFCFLAVLFHASALLAVVACFLWDYKKEEVNKKFTGIILLCFVIFINVYNYIIKYIAGFITFFNKYEYLGINSMRMNRDLYVKILILLVLFLFIKYIKQLNNRYMFFVVLYALAVIIGFTGFTTPFFKRSTLYFEFPIILLLGNLPEIFSGKANKHIARGLVCILGIAYFILVCMIIGDGNVFPYRIS
ncbi:EpsG family protein [Lachnospiraceae bacterium 48-21]